MRLATIVIALCVLCSPVWAASELSKEECRVIAADLQRMSNLNPRDVEANAPRILDRLRNGETLTSYFIAMNIYAENLFNKGKAEKARVETERMIEEAFGQTDDECKVIALRTQGTFYYKLGLYERAVECFRKAMEMCPRYDSRHLESCFTWSSTLFWLVKSDIRTSRLEEAEHWLGQMDAMMRWLDETGRTDSIGYKQVMIRGLKAKIELQRGNVDAADQLLTQCQKYILPDVPSRAYVEYYGAKMLLCVREDRHQEALRLLDSLIEMHISDYKPIAAEYIYQRGVSLARLGRFDESAEALLKCIEFKKQVNEVALAWLLDEVTAQYKVKELQHARDSMRKQVLSLTLICLALAVIIGLIVITYMKIRQKNKVLARSISELNRLIRETATTRNAASAHGDSPTGVQKQTELLEIGKSVVEYINQTQCFLNADCCRETIKDGLGVSERTLAKAVLAATGLSFINYLNQLRLNVSIEMLEEKPEMTISDISTACGFGTVRQFQRIFKQCYDMSPSAYRTARSESSANTG